MTGNETTTEATTRRQRLADAAITTLARSGMRGLTHRAVDQAAGVPQGSCSYYFRTREALLQAAVERLIELDTADVTAHPALLAGGDAPEIAEALTGIIRHWSTNGRDRMLARYELMLEATRRPAVQAAFAAARDHYRALAERLLVAAGAPSSQAQTFIACLDGLIFRHLTGADPLPAAPAELRRTLLGTLPAGYRGPGPALPHPK